MDSGSWQLNVMESWMKAKASGYLLSLFWPYFYRCEGSVPEITWNSVAWVREWTVPTKLSSLVCEVSANFCGYRVPRGKRDGSLRPYFWLSRPELLLILSSRSPQLYSRGCVDPVPDPLLLRKSGSAGNQTRTSGSVARNHYTTEAVPERTWSRNIGNVAQKYVCNRLKFVGPSALRYMYSIRR
jgi:hypothetical protein